jgi:crossover junction endodeoxyribonuclease RuvC
MIIVGIDPGVTGAVAIITDARGVNGIIDTPVMEVLRNRKKRQEYQPAAMVGILKAGPVDHAFIEQVSAMPGQGVTSMFGFGKGFGIWLGIIAALGIPYTLVTPQSWKKALMAGQADKDAGRLRACQLYPGVAHLLARKKDIGRADALLIAEYGRRTMQL